MGCRLSIILWGFLALWCPISAQADLWVSFWKLKPGTQKKPAMVCRANSLTGPDIWFPNIAEMPVSLENPTGATMETVLIPVNPETPDATRHMGIMEWLPDGSVRFHPPPLDTEPMQFWHLWKLEIDQQFFTKPGIYSITFQANINRDQYGNGNRNKPQQLIWEITVPLTRPIILDFGLKVTVIE